LRKVDILREEKEMEGRGEERLAIMGHMAA
jgi:hypothetical protein